MEQEMTTRRKQHSTQFKFKVALEAVKGEQTRNQIASEHGIHPGQVTEWKQKLLTEGKELFGRKSEREAVAQAAQEAELYEQIGRLKMELEWLKKKAAQFG
jgi:transposase-like protein